MINTTVTVILALVASISSAVLAESSSPSNLRGSSDSFLTEAEDRCPKEDRPIGRYHGYPRCSAGPDPKTKKGHKYLYAIPMCQSEDLWQVDKTWGGAHITLGKWTGHRHFDDLKTWMEKTSREFDDHGHWHPSKIVGHKPHRCSGKKKNGFAWFEFFFDSRTLNRILLHASSKRYIGSKESKDPLHISGVESGHGHTKDVKSLVHTVTNPKVRWQLAVVEVDAHHVKPIYTTPIRPLKKRYQSD
ncbi:hypothetical protein ACHAWF_008633 [Thalassiosira exigua]